MARRKEGGSTYKAVRLPGGRGRKARKGVLKYYEYRGKGRIRYPRQPDGRRPTEHLPGEYESAEMMAAYHRSMAHWTTCGTIPEWVANKKKTPAARTPSPAELVGMGYTVAELAADFLDWAEHIREYSKHEVENFRCALKPLVELFGEIQAAGFTSREMIELAEHRKRKRKNSGKYINQQQGRTRKAFRYAAGKKMIPASVLAEIDVPEKMPTHHADGTPEIPEVLAVDDKIAEATLAHLPEYAADFLRVMRGCGARQAELRGMLAADLVKESPDLWSYTPAIHKTSKRRKTRTLYFGRPEIAILKKRLRRLGPTGHVFTKPRRDVRQNPQTGQMYNHDTGKREHLVPWQLAATGIAGQPPPGIGALDRPPATPRPGIPAGKRGNADCHRSRSTWPRRHPEHRTILDAGPHAGPGAMRASCGLDTCFAA